MNTKIQAMALVQQELYRAKHLSRIELKDYLQSVVSLALGRHSSQLNKLAVHYNLQPAKILLDTAIPLGTIIIEVVHHFLTHVFSTSFQNSHLAELRTTCRQSENGEIEIQITVEIQAPGVSIHLNDFNIEKIALAEGLVKQLGGTISVHGNGDLRCSIRFVDNLYTERV